MTQSPVPSPVPEATDLERRVLAHERILKSLIAYMSRTEPRFLEHLSRVFVEPLAMVRRENDHTDSEDHAEEFIRAVAALSDADMARDDAAPGPLPRRINARKDTTRVAGRTLPQDRVQISRRNGIWSVTVDGVFRGDDHECEHAEAAAAVVRLGIY